MARRKLAGRAIQPVGLGCMNLSFSYGPGLSQEDGVVLLRKALDLGYDFFDTATIYGGNGNEALIGEAISDRRDEFFLASKCVMGIEGGKRVLDGRPETIKRMCEASLERLRTEVIDLYYLHRLDRKVPIEDSVGALSELVAEGKIKNAGLSEMSADTLRKAHAVHPIAAIQSEYSLWTRNPEIAVLDACRELGVTFVAFSPVGRGFLTDRPPAPGDLHEHDIRASMPRFEADHYEANAGLLQTLQSAAKSAGCTTAQAALAWVLSRDPNIVTIPGTKNLRFLEENFGACDLSLPQDVLDALTDHFAPERISGTRYNEAAQRAIDTECFAFEAH